MISTLNNNFNFPTIPSLNKLNHLLRSIGNIIIIIFLQSFKRFPNLPFYFFILHQRKTDIKSHNYIQLHIWDFILSHTDNSRQNLI